MFELISEPFKGVHLAAPRECIQIRSRGSQRCGWHSARRPSRAMLAFSRYGNLPAREPAFSTERATTQASDGWSRPTPLARSLALEETHRVERHCALAHLEVW